MSLVLAFSLSSQNLANGQPPATSTDSKPDQYLRPNGSGWLQFGPAVLGSCKRVDLLHFVQRKQKAPKLERVTLLRADRSFPSLLGWLKKNVASVFDYSEFKPNYEDCTVSEYSLILYSDEKGGDWKMMPLIDRSMVDGSGREYLVKNVLLMVPMSENIFGKKLKHRIEEVKTLMRNIDR